jgi:hypothetical protein
LKDLTEFKGKQTKWKTAKRSLHAQLSAMKNEEGVPYVDINALPEGTQKRMWMAPLTGDKFNRDNFNVYQVMVEWTKSGSAKTYVDRYRETQDGRGAYLELVTAFDGQDARRTAINTAQSRIKSAYFEHPMRNFTFEDYCTKHIEANDELRRYQVETPGELQVSKFLRGIIGDQYKMAKLFVMDDVNNRNDLIRAIAAMKTKMQELGDLTRSRSTNDRHIGSLNTNGRGRGGNGFYHGGHSGHGRGRGGRQGRGSRQGGHSGGRGHQSNHDDGLYIAPEILNSMTSAQRAAFFKGREVMRLNDSDTANNNG